MGIAQAADSNTVQLAPIDVTANPSSDDDTPLAKDKTTTALGPLGERKLQDIPYAISVVGEDIIDNQQYKSFKDILRLMPSVQGDGARPQTRGMQGSVVQNTRLDGLNIVSTTDYPAEQFSSIEVLNGLSGSLYGPANPAGTFNFVSKRPTDETRNRVTVGVGTGLTWLKEADLSGPFDPNGRIKYRLNLLDEQGQGYNPGSQLRRQLVSLALDFQITDKDLLETNFSYYNYLDKGLPGKFALGTGVSLPHALNPTLNNLGQSYAGDNNTTETGSVHWKHDFNGNWKLDVGGLRQIADREATAVTNTLTSNTGQYTTSVGTATASRFTINSYLVSLNGSEWTGPVKHDLTLGLSGFSWSNYNPVDGANRNIGTSSLADPQNIAEPDYPDFTDRYKSAVATQRAIIIGDTLTFTPQWSLMLTGSQSRLTSRNYAKTGITVQPGSADSGWSSAVSLLYKPIEDLTLYATYADSLQQGDTAPSSTLNNPNVILAPYRSREDEVGAKWALGRINLSLAAFQIKRPYAYVQNGTYAVGGEQRNRGLEFMADGKASQNVHLFGGVTWLDPKLLDTGTASTEDTQIVGLAKYTANLLTVVDIPQVRGLSLNLNSRYVDRRATANDDSSWASGYSTFDAGASLATTLWHRNTTYRLEVENLTNRRYWTNIVPGALNGYSGAGTTSASLGNPREVQASIQVDL